MDFTGQPRANWAYRMHMTQASKASIWWPCKLPWSIYTSERLIPLRKVPQQKLQPELQLGSSHVNSIISVSVQLQGHAIFLLRVSFLCLHLFTSSSCLEFINLKVIEYTHDCDMHTTLGPKEGGWATSAWGFPKAIIYTSICLQVPKSGCIKMKASSAEKRNTRE